MQLVIYFRKIVLIIVIMCYMYIITVFNSLASDAERVVFKLIDFDFVRK